MRKESGFTLVEAVATLCIIAVCAGIAVPSFSRLLEHQQSSTALNSLVEHMAEARVAAITRRHAAVLCPTVDGRACSEGSNWSGGWMVFLDRDADRTVDSDDEVLRVSRKPIGGAMSVMSTVGRPALRFLPDGRAAGTNLTISVCNSSGDLLGSVVVNNVGRARTERPTAHTPCPT